MLQRILGTGDFHGNFEAYLRNLEETLLVAFKRRCISANLAGEMLIVLRGNISSNFLAWRVVSQVLLHDGSSAFLEPLSHNDIPVQVYLDAEDRFTREV